MEINLKDLKERISRLSNEELIKVLTTEKDEYTQEALDIANEEAQSRGGFESIQNKYQKKLSKEQTDKEEKQKRKEEVAKNYSFIDHVITVWLRMIYVYGGDCFFLVDLYSFNKEGPQYCRGIRYGYILDRSCWFIYIINNLCFYRRVIKL